VTDDRQTDHATEKYVGIGRIACTTAIPPENHPKIIQQQTIQGPNLQNFVNYENVTRELPIVSSRNSLVAKSSLTARRGNWVIRYSP